MDNNTAKLILSTYRPGGEDAADPFFAEALENARRDPDLAQWLASERALDEIWQCALRSEPVPPHLKETLLAGNHFTPARRTGIFRSRSFLPLAAAAILVLSLLIGFLVMPGPVRPIEGDRLVQEIFHLKNSGRISLGKLGGTTEELRNWLAGRNAPHDFAIPPALDALGGMGCQVFEIDGHKVSLICFVVDQDRWVHFFVMDSGQISDPPGEDPAFVSADGLVAAIWSAEGLTYVFTSADLDEAALRELI